MTRPQEIRKEIPLRRPILRLRNPMQGGMQLPTGQPLQRTRHIDQCTPRLDWRETPILPILQIGMQAQLLVEQERQCSAVTVLVLPYVCGFGKGGLVDKLEAGVAGVAFEVMLFEAGIVLKVEGGGEGREEFLAGGVAEASKSREGVALVVEWFGELEVSLQKFVKGHLKISSVLNVKMVMSAYLECFITVTSFIPAKTKHAFLAGERYTNPRSCELG